MDLVNVNHILQLEKAGKGNIHASHIIVYDKEEQPFSCGKPKQIPLCLHYGASPAQEFDSNRSR